MRRSWILIVLLLAGCKGSTPVETASTPVEDVPLYYDIGEVRRAIETASPEAQMWFDRGLGLAFGFNHEEAIACFERALELDPDCAMCHWGKAYALGPNYNNTMMTPEGSAAAHAAVQRALELSSDAAPVEKQLIEALAARYAMPAPEDRTQLEQAYADAMRAVAGSHPDDADVVALTAEAVMMLRPWKLWSHDGVAAPETAEIRGLLEAGLAHSPKHPALCHLYIHTMEAGPEVDLALPVARRLEDLTPGLGHLIHMPSHIYIWSGQYDDSLRVNLRAIEADGAFVEHAGRENFYTLYRLHNYHFVAYSGMWTGRREVALANARELVTEIPDSLLTDWADYLDVFVATPYHVMVRFGMWQELVDEPPPADGLSAATAVWRYARAVALASLGRVDEALAEQKLFLEARAAVPETRMLFQNQVTRILEVATEVLAGEIEYRRGNHEPAFKHLRQAVVLDKLLNYDEPWGWMEPAAHPLGALLTEQGKFEEAVSVYEANLERFPNNGWALHGLAEALDGLGRKEDAAAARARFEEAWRNADVEIPGSCFCKAA